MGRRKKYRTKGELLESLIDGMRSITKAEADIDEYVKTIDELNQRISDIEHYIENPNNTISRAGAIKFVEELRILRQRRRQVGRYMVIIEKRLNKKIIEKYLLMN